MEAYNPAARPTVGPVVDGAFAALHEAAKLLVSQLRRDEQAHELAHQINPCGAMTAGAHNYFHEPYRRAMRAPPRIRARARSSRSARVLTAQWTGPACSRA